MTILSKISCTKIYADPNNCKKDHTIIVDRCRMEDSSDGIANDQNGTEKEDGRQEDTAEKRGSSVVVFTLFFQNPGDTDAGSISHIMYGVREDGGAACEDAADILEDRKGQIQDKGNEDTGFCFHKAPPVDMKFYCDTIYSIMNTAFGIIVIETIGENDMQICHSV